MSDLHFETSPIGAPYADLEIRPQCTWLVLLGDINLVTYPPFFSYIDRQLRQFETVFYVLGNQEYSHGGEYAEAVDALHDFENNLARRRTWESENIENSERLGNFVFLERTRYDCSKYLTILGCTLFSDIKTEQPDSSLVHFPDSLWDMMWHRCIHQELHDRDLHWLNSEVSAIASNEPQRSIIIFTHYSPTTLNAARDPRYRKGPIQRHPALMTDLSDEICWTCPQVKLWAFGQTHFNCDFTDPQTGKRVFTNQRGYPQTARLTFDPEKVVEVIAGEPLMPGPKRELEDGQENKKKKHCSVS